MSSASRKRALALGEPADSPAAGTVPICAGDPAVRTIAGAYVAPLWWWQQQLTQAHLAQVLGLSIEDARPRFRGRVTWTEAERAHLLVHLIERDGDAPPPARSISAC